MAAPKPTESETSRRRPRLCELTPHDVADHIARATLSHVLVLAAELEPSTILGDQRAFDATETLVYGRVRELATYAIYGGYAGNTGEHLIFQCLHLFRPVLGSGVRDVADVVESEPTTSFGVVVLAALARDALAQRGTLTAPELAVLAGLDRDRVIVLAGKGEIPGAGQVAGVRGREWRFVDSDALRQWLTSRGLRWSGRP